MPNFKDITGLRFGRLVVLGVVEHGVRRIKWHCQCDCGEMRSIQGEMLRSGKTSSCGCLHREIVGARFRRHGENKSPEYRIWAGIKTRCTNPQSSGYPYYGGRGIRLCDEWFDNFPAFLAHVGRRPSGHSIDRIDNDGDYKLGNVRWTTNKEQVHNRHPPRRSPTCHAGHLLNEANAYVTSDGYRHCRICNRENARKRRHRSK